jgi:hypothetical protein
MSNVPTTELSQQSKPSASKARRNRKKNAKAAAAAAAAPAAAAAAAALTDSKLQAAPAASPTTASTATAAAAAAPTAPASPPASKAGVDTKSAPSADATTTTATATPTAATTTTTTDFKIKPSLVLTPEQIAHFKTEGYVVVPGILSAQEVEATRTAYHQTLKDVYGVDHNDLPNTAKNLKQIHVAGGILEVFYPPFKLKGLCLAERVVVSRG